MWLKKYEQQIAHGATLLCWLVLLSWPFDYSPELPARLSPFRLVAIIVAIFGAVFILGGLWVNRSRVLNRKLVTNPVFWLVCLLAWVGLSFFWGGHKLDQLVFIGLVWLGFLFTAGFYICLRASRIGAPTVFKIFVAVAVALSAFGIGQFIGDSLGWSRGVTQICSTCMYPSVGFSRISGFSREPQFFNTVLTLPYIIVLYCLLARSRLLAARWLWASLLVIFVAIMLASSRGGLIAILLITILIFSYGIYSKQYKFCVNLSLSLLVGGMVALGLVMWSGVLGGHLGVSYGSERYISHVTAGTVKLGDEAKASQQISQSIESQQAKTPSFNYIKDAKNYGAAGSVVYSTQSRLETYKIALEVWKSSPSNFVFGVGWGGFGRAAHKKNPNVFTENMVVNNQPLQFAVELGLLGVTLVAAMITCLLMYIKRLKRSAEFQLTIYLLLLAYGVELMFYSGIHFLAFWLAAALVAYAASSKQIANGRASRLRS